MRRLATILTAAFAGTVIAIACGANGTAGATGSSAPAASRPKGPLYRDAAMAAPAPEAGVPLGASLAPLIDRLKPAVVNISTTTVTKAPRHRFSPHGRGPQGDQGFDEFFERFFGRPPPEAPSPEMRGQSLGSGFIINAEGYVLTNNHVVENATDIRVRTTDNREFTAKLVGRDPLTDVALIKLNGAAKGLPTVVLGDSDALRQGDFVVAMGSPLGLRDTATLGIVSAKHRGGLSLGSTGTYDDFIQTDAAINPGNSGGPLFNLRGEVVGINTAIVSPQIGQGIGFAVPINIAKSLIPQLEKGKVVRGFIGVSLEPELTPDLLEGFGLPSGSKGALIQNVVPKGPAAKAGLQPGDFVVGVNGKAVETSGDLTRAVALVMPGQRVTLTVLRNGQKKDFSFPVATRPGEEKIARGEGTGDEGEWQPPEGGKQAKLGVTLAPLTPELASRLGIDGVEKGVVITDVAEDGPAARANIRPGDVLVEVNRQPVSTPDQVKSIIGKMKDGQVALLRVRRGDAALFVAVPVGGRK